METKEKKGGQMEEVVKFSHSSLFRTFKILIGVAFFLGGWFTILQTNQSKIEERSLQNEAKILEMKDNFDDLNLRTYKDISEIKKMLNEMSIYYKLSQKDIEELKKK